MNKRVGQIAVIFVSVRSDQDGSGYAEAAEAMDRLAAQQPGYCGMEAARGADRLGMTVSYWADETTAKAWRDNPEHRAARDAGRARWYESYELVVAKVTRDYEWRRA